MYPPTKLVDLTPQTRHYQKKVWAILHPEPPPLPPRNGEVEVRRREGRGGLDVRIGSKEEGGKEVEEARLLRGR